MKVNVCLITAIQNPFLRQPLRLLIWNYSQKTQLSFSSFQINFREPGFWLISLAINFRELSKTFFSRGKFFHQIVQKTRKLKSFSPQKFLPVK